MNKERLNNTENLKPDLPIEFVHLNVNGNRLAFYYFPKKILPKELIKLPFPKGIDSLIVLTNKENDLYKFNVVERNGTISNFCGNGAMGALAFMQQKNPAVKKINLLLQNDKTITVFENKEEGSYVVNMGECPSYNTNPTLFDSIIITKKPEECFVPTLILDELTRQIEENSPSLYKLDLTDEYPLHKLYPIDGPNSKYANYILHLLHLLDTPDIKQEFEEFIENITFQGLYSAGGEPHVLLEMSNPDFLTENPTRKDVFMKIYSFLARNQQAKSTSELVFPESINFMFFTNDNNHIKMYSSERGVLNELEFDQTDACGTGTTCLGAFLLEDNPDISPLSIKNRSNINLTVTIGDDGKFLLSSSKENIHKIIEKKSSTIPFHIEAILEKHAFLLGDIKIIEDLLIEGSDTIFGKTCLNIYHLLEGFVFSSTDHPNLGLDTYSFLGIYFQAILTKALGKRPLHEPLDVLSRNFPLNQYPNLHRSTSPEKHLSDVEQIYSLFKLTDWFTSEEIRSFELNNEKMTDLLIPMLSKRHEIITSLLSRGVEKYEETINSTVVPENKKPPLLQAYCNQAIMFFLLKESLTREQIQVLIDQGIMNETEEKYQTLFSLSKRTKEPFAKAMDLIQKNLGNKFIKDYLFFLTKDKPEHHRPIALLEVLYKGNLEPVKILYENEKLMFKLLELTSEEAEKLFFKSLNNPDKLGVVHSDLFFLISTLGCSLQIGSERGKREKVIKFLETYFKDENLSLDFLETLKKINLAITCDDYIPPNTNFVKSGPPNLKKILFSTSESFSRNDRTNQKKSLREVNITSPLGRFFLLHKKKMNETPQIDPKMPIATDFTTINEQLALNYVLCGGDIFKEQIQSLFLNIYQKPDITKIPFERRFFSVFGINPSDIIQDE